jgi:GNAT superfamily N-acetyltransferase
VTITVRALTRGDVGTFISLIEALAEYEKLAPPDDMARNRLAHDAFATPPRFSVLLGELDHEIVGYAVFFETYSTFLALPTLYLEDIFVLPAARRKGVGEALMRACGEDAERRGCGRLEWQVLSWNDLALDFYEALGASPLHADWRSYRLEGEALQRLTHSSRKLAASG